MPLVPFDWLSPPWSVAPCGACRPCRWRGTAGISPSRRPTRRHCAAIVHVDARPVCCLCRTRCEWAGRGSLWVCGSSDRRPVGRPFLDYWNRSSGRVSCRWEGIWVRFCYGFPVGWCRRREWCGPVSCPLRALLCWAIVRRPSVDRWAECLWRWRTDETCVREWSDRRFYWLLKRK